ncbi:MATE family efflux transporter [Tepidibacter thalassicus]|uniref:Multidrug export protein MepA n=1 Tax=Tepidibacter thalassicus DSM 15285 TaxID=1123350 RepID=A0A1M5QTR9_9FIRM|nr:MATE family efflux transporter [Tepidibacter thalassicus]SHH17321.1 putative efflux protein, MATE family [Tepidibacter thalassicus DSM 15285]
MRDQRAKMMGEEKIGSVLTRLAIPGIIAMLINAVYNIIDTMFVGMLNNTSAIGAVSVVFPMFMLIAAMGQMFGVGSGSYISRLLGEKNKEQADKTTSTTFFTSVIFSIIFTIIGVIFLEQFLVLFGATDTILFYAKDYAKILVFGSTFTICNMTLNNMIRAEGNAKYSMIAISLGALINIILDPILMFSFNMGIKGAALATVLAQMISFIYLISYFILGKSYIKISIKHFKPSKDIYSEILKIGAATFARQSLASLSLGLINVAAKPYGDAAVAAMGISLRILSIGIYVVFGYNQGFQPIAGYNYGAKKYDRLFEAIKISLKTTTIFTAIVTVVFIVFAKEITSVFTIDPEVIDIGAKTLKTICLLFPLFGFQQVYASLFQGLGRGKESFILSASRQGIFLIPSIVILPKFWGLYGVIFSQVVADFFTIMVTGVLALKLNKSLKEEEINSIKIKDKLGYE